MFGYGVGGGGGVATREQDCLGSPGLGLSRLSRRNSSSIRPGIFTEACSLNEQMDFYNAQPGVSIVVQHMKMSLVMPASHIVVLV